MSKRAIPDGVAEPPNKRTALDDGNESSYYEDSEEYSESEPNGFAVPTASESKVWNEAISKVIKSVVSIQFSNIINFDTEMCVTSEATGFVVDFARGIILTNRHVVGPGPFSGYAVFDNHEEAVVTPIYRDPIHDFGFLKFDPTKIKHMKVLELELRPDLAEVGTEIRVVGNDDGQKLSILSGFISRVDRNSPLYGDLTYNDFNTEYIQAAASASGGSSGSPVVNENGQAVALQAGGSTQSSTDFFLPLHRPLRALKCIQEGKPITRGDIQVTWTILPFQECRRLGLTLGAEANARKLFPSISGLLVCETVLPEGPADGLIQVGDTLISIAGQPISTFITADEILDENVGNTLEYVIHRGGKEVVQQVTIGDLHAITPNRYVEIAGASFNDLSYQLARNLHIPVKGVYVNNANGTFDFNGEDVCGLLLDRIDDQPTPDLDTFIQVMKNIPDRQKVAATYRDLSDLHLKRTLDLYIDRHWHSEFVVATRNDETGLWDMKSLQDKPLPPVVPTPRRAKFLDLPIPKDDARQACAKLSRSFVQVLSFSRISVDGFRFSKSVGQGIIIDAKNGYVLVSRRLVPHDIADIYLIFAHSVDVIGKVVFLHPNLNYAIVKYDPSLVDADLHNPTFSDKPLKRGDKTFFIGCNFGSKIVSDDVVVSSIGSLAIQPGSGSPRYRASNIESIFIESTVAEECHTGILVDNDGTFRAFWLAYLGDEIEQRSFIYKVAMDVTDAQNVIKTFRKNEVPRPLRIVDAEFAKFTVIQARTRGVPQSWIDRFEQDSEDEVMLSTVVRISAPDNESEKSTLKFSDIILTVNDKLITNLRDLASCYDNNDEELTFKLVREGQVMDVVVPTTDTSHMNTSRVVFWCGATIQEPHHRVHQLMENIPSRVYVSQKSVGGPMAQYGANTDVFITHVNDQETPDLETFVNLTKSIPDNTYVKLRLVSFEHVPGAMSLKTNYHYFPTREVKRDMGTGEWLEIDHQK